MEPQSHRGKAKQLADDLAWLEDHCRRNSELTVHAAHLRLAAALTRNVIGPRIDGQPARPLYIAVVGGAGTGKSTVVNFLAGSVVADANPQAGFTRHPTAFLPANLAGSWPSHDGFLGPLQRLSDDKPANLDEDVYQVKRIVSATGANPFQDFAIWDCPDMTTWASNNYVSRLMEVVALADVVVYVASDERYNDEVPTQFLHLVIKAGKPVVCCLTKMRETDEAPLTAHFRQEILGKLPANVADIPAIPVTAIPNIPPAMRADPSGAGAKYRAALWNPILALCPTLDEARARTVANAVKYLESAGQGLLDVARRDLGELDVWHTTVVAGQRRFAERYRSEYLSGEAFRAFDTTRDQVLGMLELAGPGKAVSSGFAVLRMPYQYLRDLAAKTLARPPALNLSEHVVCTSAFTAWLDGLQAEALRRSAGHPLWKQLTHGFDADLKTKAFDLFQQRLRSLEAKESDELQKSARAVPEKLSGNPVLLNLIRVAVVLLDLAAIGLVVALSWPPTWWLILLIPLGVALTHQVVELVVKQAVDVGRNRLKAERETLLAEQLTGPMAAWLNEFPAQGGSSIERLQLILRRVPESIRELAALAKPPAPVHEAKAGEA
jgi:hypothetical protein